MYETPTKMILTSRQVLCTHLLVKIPNRKGEGRFYCYEPQVSFGHDTALHRLVCTELVCPTYQFKESPLILIELIPTRDIVELTFELPHESGFDRQILSKLIQLNLISRNFFLLVATVRS